MTLQAKNVLDYLTTLLQTESSLNVIGPDVSYSENETVIKPIIELHISGGNFFDIGSATLGDKNHRFTIQITIIVSKPASIDLAVIEDPSSTPLEIASAIASGQKAGNEAYEETFNVFELIFLLINNRENYDFGLDKFSIKSKELGKYKINRHIVNGNMATVFGEMNVELKVLETVEGSIPTTAEDPIVIGYTDGSLPD
jgi:hypothetical protein